MGRGRETDLTGLGIDVSLGKELLHDPHVLWAVHGREGSQHDGRVARFVLVINVANLWRNGRKDFESEL